MCIRDRSRATHNQLPMTDGAIAAYQARKSRIWMDDREEIQVKLKEQTRRYEDIFKNEFVLTVLKLSLIHISGK